MTLKFRSPTEEHIFLSVDSGHTADVGPEPMELPKCLHREAFQQGCITDELSTDERGSLTGEHTKSTRDLVRDAIIEMVETADQDEFTLAGLPKLPALRARLGFGVERDVAESVWAEVMKSREAGELDIEDGDAD